MPPPTLISRSGDGSAWPRRSSGRKSQNRGAARRGSDHAAISQRGTADTGAGAGGGYGVHHPHGGEVSPAELPVLTAGPHPRGAEGR